jgi:hypothetical protein
MLVRRWDRGFGPGRFGGRCRLCRSGDVRKGWGWVYVEGSEAGRRVVHTRMQMLQLHSWMSPLYEERGPEVFNARVTAPQWQLPV